MSGGLSPTSPKAKVAALLPNQLPEPTPDYTGPRFEPLDAQLTLEWAMQLVRHFQHHPRVPLPARYLFRLLDLAEKVLEDRDNLEGPVQTMRLKSEANARNGVLPAQSRTQLTIVGDTHGQLADVLWIFYKLGVPSPSNRYLFNGDVCDRGEFASEIWALLLVFMCLWPQSVVVQRGNHEDRLLNMDSHCGGFYDEVLSKYGRFGTGPLVYEKFARLFARLPLATIIDDQVFVVHGGLSRGAPGRSFLRLLGTCRSRTAEIPGAAGASPADLAFVDAMWADPQETPGVAPNPRGAGLALFGPDVTHRFLAETGLALVVRSHQVPPNYDGFYQHHSGRLVTVFSASNYCGLTGNQGAVLVFRPDGTTEAVRHFAPALERLVDVVIDPPEVGPAHETAPLAWRNARVAQRKSTAGTLEKLAKGTEEAARAKRLESEVLRGAARFIVEKKQALFAYWEECDCMQPRGFIRKRDWEEGMQAVLGDSLPWKTIGKVLRVTDDFASTVDYRRFLGRFRVAVVGGPAGGDRWLEELLGRFYGRLLALKGDAGSLEELEGFLGGGDGKVSPEDALEAFRWVLGNCITEEQANALLRTLAAHSAPDPSPVGRPVGVFEFLSRLDVCYKYEAGVVQGTLLDDGDSKASRPAKAAREPTQWAQSVLTHLGRLLWMEDAVGSPKAGSQRMLEVFRYFDADGDGLLQRGEFAEAIKALLSEYRAELPNALVEETVSDERISELVDAVDFSGDGLINYLEFLHAFQPVDTTPGRGLRTDLMEQICTTIWANKPSLLRTLQILEERAVPGPDGFVPTPGRVSKEILRHTLRSLNASLEATRNAHGAPLTSDQIDILVDHAAVDADGTLDYKAFLDAFQIVDTGAPPEEAQASAPVAQAHSRPVSPVSPTAVTSALRLPLASTRGGAARGRV